MQSALQPSSSYPVLHMPSSMCSEVPTLILAVSNFHILLPEKQLIIFVTIICFTMLLGMYSVGL